MGVSEDKHLIQNLATIKLTELAKLKMFPNVSYNSSNSVISEDIELKFDIIVADSLPQINSD